MDLESLEKVLLLEVSLKFGGCRKSHPVCELPMDFHICCSAVSPHGSQVLQLSWCVRAEE